ncbi:Hypothetical predicted protein [Mytilus galloprovincialis]|uniref:Uncharacterized protein n=1 Tax=Mytilus galloprovincialis TaxID=29158 RepID=A0A8B6BGB2_MYTGA|nr:Hypothetical predicted protein [Mytilus galloprovincialis]
MIHKSNQTRTYRLRKRRQASKFIGLLVMLCFILLPIIKRVTTDSTVYMDDMSDLQPSLHCNGLNITVPRIIWLFWDKGPKLAPNLQQACMKSWEIQNPEYETIHLNLLTAEKLIRRKEKYKDDVWNNISIQAKSDIIRVELLAKYGGVWVDATVRCNIPLIYWIEHITSVSHFFVFERTDLYITPAVRPHIASWFIASSNCSYIVQTLRKTIQHIWAKQPNPYQVYGYFWLHKVFLNLVKNDVTFFNAYTKMTFLSADGPHCREEGTWKMNKMTAVKCRKKYPKFGI